MNYLHQILHPLVFVSFTKIGRIKPVCEVMGCLSLKIQGKRISERMRALTASSFSQSIIARLVLNLLKSRDIIVVLQRSIAFDVFPL